MTIDKQKLKALAEATREHLPGVADPQMIVDTYAVLALLAEIERLEREQKNDLVAYKAVIERQEELRIERDQLKAENEALRGLVLSALEEGKGRPGAGGNAPGHCHAVPGVWDRGNGERSGTACGWCRIWNAAQAMAKEANHG